MNTMTPECRQAISTEAIEIDLNNAFAKIAPPGRIPQEEMSDKYVAKALRNLEFSSSQKEYITSILNKHLKRALAECGKAQRQLFDAERRARWNPSKHRDREVDGATRWAERWDDVVEVVKKALEEVGKADGKVEVEVESEQ